MRARAPEGPNSQVSTFAVDGLKDLERATLPFFELHPPRIKISDFRSFAEVVRGMRTKEHLTHFGFERLVRLAYGMNAHGKQRSRTIDEILAGSPETGRGAPYVEASDSSSEYQAQTVKVQSDPHGDMGSWAEMTQPAGA